MTVLAMESPVGFLRIQTDNAGMLRRIDFMDDKAAEDEVRAGEKHPVVGQLREYFAGKRQSFDVEYATAGTDFQQQVWRQLAGIPFGEMRTYGDIAKAIGKPGSSRAVGAACGSNPVAIIVPCHRVIGAGNKLTGFGGGLHRKAWLLQFEGVSV